MKESIENAVRTLNGERQGDVIMETRREKKNIVLKMPRSQWVNRKYKQVNAKVKSIIKRIKHG